MPDGKGFRRKPRTPARWYGGQCTRHLRMRQRGFQLLLRVEIRFNNEQLAGFASQVRIINRMRRIGLDASGKAAAPQRRTENLFGPACSGSCCPGGPSTCRK
jgi:hypothetical protein